MQIFNLIISILKSGIIKLIPNLFRKRKCKGCEIKNVDLLNHYFFAKIQGLISLIVPNMKFCNEKIKNILMRRYLIIGFQTIYDEMHKLAVFVQEQIKKGNIVNLSEINDAVIDMLSSYPALGIAEGIPDILVRKWDEWNDKHIANAVLEVREIFGSHNYMHVYSRISALFNVASYVCGLIVKVSENMMNDLNGELSEALYKWRRENKDLAKKFSIDKLKKGECYESK